MTDFRATQPAIPRSTQTAIRHAYKRPGAYPTFWRTQRDGKVYPLVGTHPHMLSDGFFSKWYHTDKILTLSEHLLRYGYWTSIRFHTASLFSIVLRGTIYTYMRLRFMLDRYRKGTTAQNMTHNEGFLTFFKEGKDRDNQWRHRWVTQRTSLEAECFYSVPNINLNLTHSQGNLHLQITLVLLHFPMSSL